MGWRFQIPLSTQDEGVGGRGRRNWLGPARGCKPACTSMENLRTNGMRVARADRWLTCSCACRRAQVAQRTRQGLVRVPRQSYAPELARRFSRELELVRPTAGRVRGVPVAGT